MPHLFGRLVHILRSIEQIQHKLLRQLSSMYNGAIPFYEHNFDQIETKYRIMSLKWTLFSCIKFLMDLLIVLNSVN